MASTLLEQARAIHADIDELEQYAADALRSDVHGHRERLYEEHRVKKAVESIIERSAQLSAIYEDASGVRKDELAAISGLNALSIFYDRLKDLRELHKDGAGDELVRHVPASEPIRALEEPVLFSGQEGYGRYLDLYAFHTRSLNMKQFGQTDYLNFLRVFYKFDRVDKSLKNTAEYKQFLSDLFAYLAGFLARTQPLLDTEAEWAKADQDFEEAWRAGTVPGWSADDAAVGSNPLYCAACQHLFAKESVFQAHLGGKRHQRAVKGLSASDAAQATGGGANPLRAIAQLEYRIAHAVRAPLASKLEDTIAHIQKKLASTYEELMADIEDMETEGAQAEEPAEEESDEEEKPIYNPKGLPLGWDGKPIPYWLWKLHGLNQEFKCEICGNHSYWGPRNFERHFQEPRHQYGMRCLHIPNTKHFQGITQIQDAYTLYEKLKKEGALKEWNAEREEELEDAEGNVYSKKIYEELRRQGII